MRFAFIVFIFFYSSSFFAQVQNGGIVVFDDFENNPFITKRKPIGEFKNIIKLGMLSPARGIYEIGYERLLPQNFSVEAFVGYTYKDFLFERFSSNGLYGSSGVKAKGGFSVRAAIKYYPFSEGWFSGFYFSNEIAYRKHGFQQGVVEVTDEGMYQNRNLRLMYDFLEARFQLGQNISDRSGRFFVDYRIGLIFRNIRATYPIYINSNNNLGAHYEINTSSRFGPALGFNIMMGYAF